MKARFSLHAVALAAAISPFAGAPAHATDQTAWLQEQLRVTDGYEPASRQAYFATRERAAASPNRDGIAPAPVAAKTAVAPAPDSASRSKQ
jgi:hypothetical protein